MRAMPVFSLTVLAFFIYFYRLSLYPDPGGRMDTAERWVHIEKVAAHLDVTKDSIYRWIERKNFPAHRVGRLLRFKLSEVDEWVQNGGGSLTSRRKA